MDAITLHTGGCNGADLAFRRTFPGHVIVYTFPGHKTAFTGGADIMADPADEVLLVETARRLIRGVGRPGYIHNLLLRNMTMVRLAAEHKSAVLVAVGRMEGPQSITGGTAWGCKAWQTEGTGPAFFFDQASETWHQLDETRRLWQVMGMERPCLDGVEHLVGIGSRELTAAGKAAIAGLA